MMSSQTSLIACAMFAPASFDDYQCFIRPELTSYKLRELLNFALPSLILSQALQSLTIEARFCCQSSRQHNMKPRTQADNFTAFCAAFRQPVLELLLRMYHWP